MLVTDTAFGRPPGSDTALPLGIGPLVCGVRHKLDADIGDISMPWAQASEIVGDLAEKHVSAMTGKSTGAK